MNRKGKMVLLSIMECRKHGFRAIGLEVLKSVKANAPWAVATVEVF